MPDLPPLTLSRAQRHRLQGSLAALPFSQAVDGRALLLEDLPSELVAITPRSNIPAVDLTNLIQNTLAWGRLNDGIPAVLMLIDNALHYGGGSQAGEELAHLGDELRAMDVALRQATGAGGSTPASGPPPPATTAPGAATVLLVAPPADQAAAARLVRALQLRGLRVRWDHPGEQLGWLHHQALEEILAGPCDAVVLWVSATGLTAPLLWESALPKALARLANDAYFPIIPVLHGVTLADLPPAGADLVHLQPQPLPVDEIGSPRTAFADLARLILGQALKHRIRSPAASATSLTISLRTFPYHAPEPVHLDLDWTAVFREVAPGQVAPPPAIWTVELLPALADVADALAEHAPSNQVRAWLKGRLTAMTALGYQFPFGKGTLRVTWCEEFAGHQLIIPPSPNHGEPSDGLWLQELSIGLPAAPGITLELAISRSTREVFPKVVAWQAGRESDLRTRLQAWPAAGPSFTSLVSADQAWHWATQINQAVRNCWGAGVVQTHLFQAGPAVFAALLGQHLYDLEGNQHPVYCYELPASGYTLACILGQP